MAALFVSPPPAVPCSVRGRGGETALVAPAPMSPAPPAPLGGGSATPGGGGGGGGACPPLWLMTPPALPPTGGRCIQTLCDEHPSMQVMQGHRGVRHCCSRHHEGHPRVLGGGQRCLLVQGGGVQQQLGTMPFGGPSSGGGGGV